MFRYERPQKGRLRQFHQAGIELIGVAEPQADIEAITLAADVLDALGVLDKTVLEINTLGDPESRRRYRDLLVSYLNGHRDRLSKESLDRLERNPLRILDSKDEGDRAVIADAPRLEESLNDESRDFFARVLDGLAKAGVEVRLNPYLVRGLDYYCHTTFEFTTEALGAQGTVLAGGRYDGLIGMMGGPETPGVGWAAGVDRLSLLTETAPDAPRPIALVPLGERAEGEVLRLARDLRRRGLVVDLAYGGNMKKRMKRANKVNARFAAIIGDDELDKGVVALKDLDRGEQQEVALADLAARLGEGMAADGA